MATIINNQSEDTYNTANVFNVLTYGAKGDGKTDDTAAINSAVNNCFNAGGGVVYFPNRSYVISRVDLNLPGYNNSPGIRLKAGVSLLGDRATLILKDATAFIGTDFNVLSSTVATITQNADIGADTFTVDNINGFNVGDDVFIRYGNNEWDIIETCYTEYAKILKVSSNSLQIDRPMKKFLDVSIATAHNRSITKMVNPIHNIFVEGFYLYSDGLIGNAEAGIDFRYVQDCRITNIRGINVGAGIVMMAYCHNIKVENIHVERSIMQKGQGSKGRVLNYWNCVNVLTENVIGENFEGAAFFFESYSRNLQFKNIKLVDNFPNRVSNGYEIMCVVQGSEAYFENFILEGNGGSGFVNTGSTTGNIVKFRNLTLKTKTIIKGELPMNWLEGVFTYWDTDGTVNSFDFDNLTERTLEIVLVDGMCSIYKLPKGLWKQINFELPNTTTKDDFTNVCLGRINATWYDYTSKLISGDEFTTTQGFGSSYPQAIDYNANTQVLVGTQSSGITDNNKMIIIRITFAQIL